MRATTHVEGKAIGSSRGRRRATRWLRAIADVGLDSLRSAPMSSPTAWLAVGGRCARRRRERPDRLDDGAGVVFVVGLRMAPRVVLASSSDSVAARFEKGAARGARGQMTIRCIDGGGSVSLLPLSRMQERDGLRSRAGGRSQLVPSGHARRGFETLAPDARRRLRRPARVPDDRRLGSSSRGGRTEVVHALRPSAAPETAGASDARRVSQPRSRSLIRGHEWRDRGARQTPGALPDERRGRHQQGCGAVRGDSAARSASAQSSSSETSRPRRRASGSRSSSRIHSASSRVSTNRATASR
jgi:hypothetical protein